MAWLIFPVNDVKVVVTITVFYYKFLTIWTNFIPIVFVPLYLLTYAKVKHMFFGSSSMQMTFIFSDFCLFFEYQCEIKVLISRFLKWGGTVKVIPSNCLPWALSVLGKNCILVPACILSRKGPIRPCLPCQISSLGMWLLLKSGNPHSDLWSYKRGMGRVNMNNNSWVYIWKHFSNRW